VSSGKPHLVVTCFCRAWEADVKRRQAKVFWRNFSAKKPTKIQCVFGGNKFLNTIRAVNEGVDFVCSCMRQRALQPLNKCVPTTTSLLNSQTLQLVSVTCLISVAQQTEPKRSLQDALISIVIAVACEMT